VPTSVQHLSRYPRAKPNPASFAAIPNHVNSSRTDRRPTYQLRLAVEALPTKTKEAMLRGLQTNRIIVGAYVDPRSGGVCPMLAAHRNGGRTSVASFARAWDAYTGAKKPRRATRREVRTLTALLEWSLAADGANLPPSGSIAELAAQIRAEREAFRCAESAAADRPELLPPDVLPEDDEITIRRRRDTGERHRGRELRLRPHWAWLRPTRRYDDFKDLLAAAEEQLSEQRAAELLDAPLDPAAPETAQRN
jgi:hypothetical protein